MNKKMLECITIRKPIKLKPCPFCGNDVRIRERPVYGYEGNFEYYIQCECCGCTNTFATGNDIYHEPEYVIKDIAENWNYRTIK